MRLDVVAGVFELLERELLGLALDLLHRQHVDALAHREVDDPVDPGADGVDVPGGQTHGIKPTATPPTRAVHRRRRAPQGGRGSSPGSAQSPANARRPRPRVRSGSPRSLERQHPGVAALDAGRDPVRRPRACDPRPRRAESAAVDAAVGFGRDPHAARGIRRRSLAEEGDAAPAEEREVVERMPGPGLIPVDHAGEAVAVARSSCMRRCRCGRSSCPARATRRSGARCADRGRRPGRRRGTGAASAAAAASVSSGACSCRRRRCGRAGT